MFEPRSTKWKSSGRSSTARDRRRKLEPSSPTNWTWQRAWQRNRAKSCCGNKRWLPEGASWLNAWPRLVFANCANWTATSGATGRGATRAQRRNARPSCAGVWRITGAVYYLIRRKWRAWRNKSPKLQEPSSREALSTKHQNHALLAPLELNG